MSATTISAFTTSRLRRLAIVGILGVSLCFVAPPAPASEDSAAVQQQDEKKKKRKKQRGKVVKATVVPVAPAEEATEPEAAEESQATETAPEEPAREEQAEQAEAAAEAREAKKADREARRREEQDRKERERAERAAAKQQEEEQRAADREQRREAEQAEQAARAAADREASRKRAEAREAERAEAEAAAQRAADEKAASRAQARAEEEARAAERQQSNATEEASASGAVSTETANTEAANTETATVRARSAAPAPTPAPTPAVADRPAPASDVRPADLSETIQVREVLLDVLVTDRKGNVIEGLEAGDFEVTEDGNPVEVTSVVFYGGSEELQSAGIEERRTDRYFILLFHDQAQAAPFLRAAQLDNGRWAQKWIEEELQPNDQVAVLGYDVRLKVFQDFTTDKLLLSQAVGAATRGGAREPDRWRTEEADPARDGSPSLLLNLPKGKALARETRRMQTALELLGRASEGIIGRKNLMLFSAGFGSIDDIGVWTPDPRFYPQMKQSLNTGNVAVYSIDLVGSRRGAPGGRDINDALSAISNDTGGHYYSTFANALTPLRNVAEDNLGYYLLSYRSQFERGTSGYREVKVKVEREAGGKKPKVKARKGYRFGT